MDNVLPLASQEFSSALITFPRFNSRLIGQTDTNNDSTRQLMANGSTKRRYRRVTEQIVKRLLRNYTVLFTPSTTRIRLSRRNPLQPPRRVTSGRTHARIPMESRCSRPCVSIKKYVRVLEHIRSFLSWSCQIVVLRRAKVIAAVYALFWIIRTCYLHRYKYG